MLPALYLADLAYHTPPLPQAQAFRSILRTLVFNEQRHPYLVPDPADIKQ